MSISNYKKKVSNYFYNKKVVNHSKNLKTTSDNKKSLAKIFVENKTTKTRPETVQYCSIYPIYLENLRDEDISMLEIGVQGGGSIKSWREYFPKAKIYGLDIDDCKQYEDKNIKIFIGDQADKKYLNQIIEEIDEKLDLIIDDGGHTMEQQINSFLVLFPKLLKNGGIYIIEDLHTSYLNSGFSDPIHNGGNVNDTHTTINMLKQLIDNINDRWCTPEIDIKNIDSMHCHDGMMVIIKSE